MSELIIDADSHITEPPDLWTSRVAAKDKDRVPHVVVDDKGAEIWVLNDVRIDTVGVQAPAGWPDFPASYPPRMQDCHPGSYSAVERLKYMDEAGIWAQILFPNVAGFGAQRFLQLGDERLQLECVRAFNDFQYEEWASVNPNRLIPNISLPFWNVKEAVAEVERNVARGFKTILFTGEPLRFGLPPLGSKEWDPLYSVAQEAGLPMQFHIGGGEGEDPVKAAAMAARLRDHGSAGMSTYTAVDLFLKNGVQCADLISSGALERFPALNFVSVESGVGWLPFMLEAADYTYLGATKTGRKRGSELLPSELFRRQVYVTYWFEQVAPHRLLDELPIDNILFETDFPHTACLYGNIRETIEAGLGGVSTEIREKLLWHNSARLFGIDIPERIPASA